MEWSVKARPQHSLVHTPGLAKTPKSLTAGADGRRAVSEECRKSVTPFGGWVRNERSGRLRPLQTAPHIGGFGPPDTGKTRKWLSQGAVLWPGPALVSSSKDDLMQLVASRRYGSAALLDLRPIDAPYYPAEFTRYRFDPTQPISTLEDAQAVAETLLSISAVASAGVSFPTAADPGPWNQLAFAPLTCLLFAATRLHWRGDRVDIGGRRRRGEAPQRAGPSGQSDPVLGVGRSVVRQPHVCGEGARDFGYGSAPA
jgi:hypothetical protein